LVAWAQPQGFIKGRYGFVAASWQCQRHAQIAMRPCQIRIEVNGNLQARDGIVGSPKEHFTTGQSRLRDSIARIHPSCRAGKSSPNTMPQTRSGQCQRRKYARLERMRSAQSSRRERSQLVLRIVFRCRRGSRRPKPSPRSRPSPTRAGRLPPRTPTAWSPTARLSAPRIDAGGGAWTISLLLAVLLDALPPAQATPHGRRQPWFIRIAWLR
jgi:hypothetical protein